MTVWTIAFFLSTAFAAAGFVVVAVMWLKKLRETLVIALGETAAQQVKSAQRLGESLSRLQRQQHVNDEKIRALIDANMRLRQDLDDLTGKVEIAERDSATNTPSRMIH